MLITTEWQPVFVDRLPKAGKPKGLTLEDATEGSNASAACAQEDQDTPAPEGLPRTRKPGSGASKRRKRSYLPAQERRRLIIEAAQQVFGRTSLQGARTRDLAKAAGINQATLFEHFSSKEDLFKASVVQPLLEAMRGMRDRAETYEAAGSGEEMLSLAQDSSRRHLESMIEIYPLLTAALFAEPETGKKLYREQIAPLLKQRTDVLSPLVRDTIDPDLVSLAAFGIYFAIAMDRLFTNKSGDISGIARQVSDLLTFGFARESLRD